MNINFNRMATLGRLVMGRQCLSQLTRKVNQFLYISSNIHSSRSSNNKMVQESRRYIPRRAVLYVPGNDIKKLNKIKSVEADCIVMDCEDGVAVSKKADARETILSYLSEKIDDFQGKDCAVRINGMDSELYEDDIRTILSGPNFPTTLLLPKVEGPDHISLFSEVLKKYVNSNKAKFLLVIYVESAKSLLGLPALCEKAVELSKQSNFILDGIVFGSDDFCADIGATRTSEANETLFARQWTVTTAKAYKLQAIDIVYIDYKDIKGLRRQSLEGAQMGFTGKQVIHPGQIDVVQEAFSPSGEKVLWAQDLIAAFEKHQKEGMGAFTFRGNMIDRPLLLQAQNILQISKHT